jgi:uncharacterized Fe-S cluster-containing radical SAM superfamily enzyme
MKRSRMIFDLPFDIQMAIKLRAVKDNCTTGEVVAKAVEKVIPIELEEAKEVLKGGDA